MLDLEAIFNPDVIEAELAAQQCQAAPEIGVDDLPGDWRVEFEERAAIKEYDGRLPRERAEAEALADILCQIKAAKEKNEKALDNRPGVC